MYVCMYLFTVKYFICGWKVSQPISDEPNDPYVDPTDICLQLAPKN